MQSGKLRVHVTLFYCLWQRRHSICCLYIFISSLRLNNTTKLSWFFARVYVRFNEIKYLWISCHSLRFVSFWLVVSHSLFFYLMPRQRQCIAWTAFIRNVEISIRFNVSGSSIEYHVWVETIFIMSNIRITIIVFLFSFKTILNASIAKFTSYCFLHLFIHIVNVWKDIVSCFFFVS